MYLHNQWRMMLHLISAGASLRLACGELRRRILAHFMIHNTLSRYGEVRVTSTMRSRHRIADNTEKEEVAGKLY